MFGKKKDAQPVCDVCQGDCGGENPDCPSEDVPATAPAVVAPCRHAYEQIDIAFAGDPLVRNAARAALKAIEDKGDHLAEVAVSVTVGDRAIAVTANYTNG